MPKPKPTDDADLFRIAMDNEDGTARDFWPETPTIEQCVEVGFPTDYGAQQLLAQVWAALTIPEKERMGFTRRHRVLQIERLLVITQKKETAL